jgi:Ca2+-binding EF-hand superfamily protein
MSLRVVFLSLVYLMLPAYSSVLRADDDKTAYDQRSAARYAALFQSLDRNGDGTVTRVEAQGDLNFAPVFDDMDINRDGVVTNAELQRYLEQRYGARATR